MPCKIHGPDIPLWNNNRADLKLPELLSLRRGQCSPLTPQMLLVKHLRLHMVPREAKMPPERGNVCGELKGGPLGSRGRE